MRKIIFIAIAIIAFGCKKESQTTKTNANTALIAGTWLMHEDSVNFFFTDPSNNFNSVYVYAANNKDTYQFNSDGTGVNNKSAGGFIIDFTYKVSGNQLTLYNKSYTTNTGTYPADTSVATIEKLNSTTLNLYLDFKVDEPGSDETENNVYEYLTR